LIDFYTLIAQQNKASHHCIALSGDVRLAKVTLHTGGINRNLTHTGALAIGLF
jgi:aspartate carbamoyltransferase catalytic subunit